MRKIGMFLALILMSALSFGQAPPQKGDPAYPAYFDKAYYNHQSPAVRELLDGASNGAISQGPELPGNSRRPAASWASYAEQDARTVRAIQLAARSSTYRLTFGVGTRSRSCSCVNLTAIPGFRPRCKVTLR